MSLSNADRIQEFTYTSGVADIALEGAILGYLPFASGVGDTNSCYYTIEHYVEDEWEIGLGTYSAGVLSRDEVYVSTTGDKVPFSSGVKSVFIDIPESKRAYYDGNDNISIKRNIDLKDCVASTSGVITIDDTQFLHNFHHPTGNTAVPVGENTFLGIDAGNFTLGSDASSVAHGSYNTGVGPGALNSLTYGYSNTAFGWHAGTALASGASNTAIGTDALSQATDAYANVAVGAAALKGLIDNDARNVGIGFQALRNIGDHATNISEDNIGLGYQAGRFITGGSTLLTYANQSIFIGTGAKAQADGSTNETVVGFGTTGHGNNTVTIGNASITSNYFNGDLNVTGSGVFPDGLHTDSHGTSVNWNTAYEERGSVIPGSGLSWDGSKLNLTASLLAASGSLTYDLLASDIAGGANIRLDGSDLSQDDVKLASGTGVNVDYTSSSIITFSSDHTAGSGLVLDGVNFAHQDTSGQSSVNNPSRTYIQDVTLDEYGHVTALSSAAETVTQYTNEMAQDTVGGILADSAEISLTYVDGNPSISGDIIAGSIDVLKLDSGVQDSLGLADSALQSGDNISELTNDSSYITASSSNTLTNKSGSNSQWTNDEGYIKSADGGNAATLDSLDSTAFLRSNTSDSFTNGTLTMAVGTELLVDGLLNIDGTINIASTTISLDGPSTDFDADGGTITFNTNDLVIKTSTGYIGINETVPRAHLDVAGSGYFYSGVHTESHSTSAEWKEAHDWGDHSTQGYLTDITNESIGDLTNVNVTGAANGKILKYNSGTWEIADDNDTTYTASSFNHNDLAGLNDGTSYEHITQTEKTNFGTAYTHSGLTSGNPHSVSKSDVALGNVPNVDCTNASNITSGTISSSILPPVALTEVTVVASEVAQLALTAEEGDVAVRSDENKTYMHNGGSAGTMADWTELQTPTDTVLSVNGETGTVVLTTSEISEDADHNYVTDAQLVVIGNTSNTNTGDQSAGDFSHNSLADLNAGSTYQHITTTQESHFESAYSHISNNGSDHSYINQDVTSGSSPTFDGTNFSGIPGTALDDTYIKANGTQALTANWDAGGYEIRARTLESDVATGTAPLTIASTTLVNNLNSDKLDNQEGSYYLARGNHTGTQDISTITTGEWKVFYSNAAGVQELALGSSGKVLTANGTSSAPTWETPASVSGFVPYTGATSNVDLGEHDLDLAGMLSLNPVGATVGSMRLWDNNTEYLELKCEGNSGFITVDTDGGSIGNLYLTGNLTLFSTGASRFNGELSVVGDLLPNSDSTYDIGATGTRWQTLYVDNITTTDDGTSANWKAAYDWGDHGSIGYLEDITDQEIGDLSDVSVGGVTNGQILRYNSSSGDWEADDEVSLAGFVPYTGATGNVDLGSNDITAYNLNVANWNTAYGWGDHDGLYADLSHAHGSITSAGAVTSNVTIGTGDRILITDSSASSAVKGGVAFSTGTTTFLRNDGTWATPAGSTYTAGDGLDESGGTFSVDSSVVRTTGNQTIGGTKTFSSTISGNITGNAGTATTLATSRTLTIGSTGKSFNGSANVSWTLFEIGASTVGYSMFTVANPSAIRFVRVNADNSVTLLSDSDFRTAIGAGTGDGDGTVTSVDTGTGLTGGAITSAGTISLTGQALALHNLSSNGIIARTGSGTVAARTITAGTGISVSNGNGVSGNPTISSTITQYTDEMAQDAIGGILVDSSEIDFTYNDATPSITAALKTGSIDILKLDSGVQDSLGLADSSLQSGDNISSLTNDSNYITASSSNTLTNKSGSNSQWTNDEGYITSGDVDGTNIAQGTRTSTTVPITSSTGSNATLTAATTSLAGVMVAADKSKLDGIDSGANNYSHPTGFSNQPASALTGASVISQITVNTNGHVTGVSSRSITAANISALSSSTSSTQNGYFGNIYLRDDSTPSHYMAITCADNITANRTLSIDPNNANRTISLSGNLTVSSTATISGTNTGDQSDISDFSGTKSEFNSACTDGTFLYVGDVSTHDAVTVTDSSEIDFTLTGQDITASLKSGSIDETKLDTSVNDSLDLADSAIQAADLGSAAYEATSAFAAASHAHGSITSAGAVTTNVTVANTDRILITDASDSSKVKGGTAFGTSTSTYLRNNGTWGTPTNTTYSEISESEITTGTSSTSRTITGRRAAFIISQASYTHPSYNGDDFSVDTGALTGAWVVSDVDINVTTDSTGHVVDANGSVNTRQLTYSDIGAAASSHAHGNITSAGAIGSTANLVVVTTTAGALTAKTAGTTSQYLRGDGSWATPTNTTYSEISESEIDTGTSSTSRTITGRRAAYIISKSAAASHSHGNITSAGAIGGTANLPIITTTGGVLTTGSFGSSANTFCEGDDSRLSDARTPTSHDNTYHSTNYAAETITLTAGTGLTGGGNLTTNRTFTVSYGTSAGTACQGNDSRLLSSAQKTDLTDSGASTAHYHTADRARANHTGTQDVSTLTAGNHKIFYSDGSGDVQELTHGSNGYVLTSNGSTSAPSWQAAAGGGGLTGMTEGAVIFGSSTGTEDEDPTVFFWDKSANELAIGHAAPDCGLHVKDGQALIGHFEAASSAVPYAYVEIEAEDTSDDPQLNFNNGSDNWTVGVDHTDTSFWMIPAGAQVFGSYSGDYVRFDSSGGQELTGSIELVASVNSTDGYITKGGTIFLHDYTADYTNGFNTFLGLDAGNPSGMTFTGSAVNASYNTGAGYNALTALTTGTSNVAIGYSACAALTTGTDQAAVGTEALANCTTSTHNTAIGTAALKDVANNDNRNTAIGFQALRNIGSHVSNDSEDNLAIGYQAGRYITGGSTELTYANQSIFFGTGAKAKADGSTNELVFGFGATGNGNNTITLGNNSITSTYLKGTVKAYTATNTTANVLRFGDRDTGYGFDFRYTGAGTGNDNALEFYTDAETSGPNSTRVFIIGQDGNIIFDNDIDIAGDLSVDGVIDLLDTTNSVGQIKINSNIVFHTYEPEGNNTNTFVGRNCGNYTMTHSTGNESRYNVAVGYNALNSLTTGYGNFGLGTSAGTAITSGYENFFAAYAAGLAAQTPIRNVGIGPYTCYANNSSYNIGICYYALRSALGSANIALGYSAGRSLVGSGGSSDGSYNIYMGYASGYNGSQDTDSSYNICIGYNTFATGNYGIAIGKSVYAGTNECVIGGSTITRTSLQGNLCIDDCAQPTSNGGAVIALPDNTNEPTMATGTAGLYADDVSGTVELFAVGDDGSQAQISPHDPVTGDWIFFGYHAKKKKWQKVNMEKLVRAIEDLTGQSFLDEWEGDKNRN
jgi:hypothetical protein